MAASDPKPTDYIQYRLESSLLPKAKARLQGLGAACLHVHGEPLQESAVDIVGVYKSHAFCIELKVGNNVPTERQKLFLQKWARAGAFTGVAYTVADCLAVLQEIEREVDR